MVSPNIRLGKHTTFTSIVTGLVLLVLAICTIGISASYLFIDQMNVGERPRSVVVSITALTHGLGMTVLAEGIEEVEQRQTLVELGCERGQGFLFCRPIPAEDFNLLYIDPNRQLARAFKSEVRRIRTYMDISGVASEIG